MRFHVVPHLVRPDVQVVEVFDDAGNFIATVTQGEHPRQIKIMSKYMTDVGRAPFNLPPIPAAVIELAETPVVGF